MISGNNSRSYIVISNLSTGGLTGHSVSPLRTKPTNARESKFRSKDAAEETRARNPGDVGGFLSLTVIAILAGLARRCIRRNQTRDGDFYYDGVALSRSDRIICRCTAARVTLANKSPAGLTGAGGSYK